MINFLWITITLLSLNAFCGDKNLVLSYEPSVVELTGSLDIQTFPGPPNYTSIKDGDAIERHFYLKLDHIVDVIPLKEGHPTIDNAEPEMNVKIMMLAVSSTDTRMWAKLRGIGKGGRVKIKGTLFRRWTGHHHSRVILNVSSLDAM